MTDQPVGEEELPDDAAEGQDVPEDEFTEEPEDATVPSDDELPEPESPETDEDTPDLPTEEEAV